MLRRLEEVAPRGAAQGIALPRRDNEIREPLIHAVVQTDTV